MRSAIGVAVSPAVVGVVMLRHRELVFRGTIGLAAIPVGGDEKQAQQMIGRFSRLLNQSLDHAWSTGQTELAAALPWRSADVVSASAAQVDGAMRMFALRWGLPVRSAPFSVPPRRRRAFTGEAAGGTWSPSELLAAEAAAWALREKRAPQ